MKDHDWKKTRWMTEDGHPIATIQEVLSVLEDQPVVKIDVADIERLRKNVVIDQHRLDVADTSYPIIIVEDAGTFQYILDGHHRLQKAINQKQPRVPAKILKSGTAINRNL